MQLTTSCTEGVVDCFMFRVGFVVPPAAVTTALFTIIYFCYYYGGCVFRFLASRVGTRSSGHIFGNNGQQ